MVVLATSAIVAVLFDEPERPELIGRIAVAARRLVSVGTLVEASIDPAGLNYGDLFAYALARDTGEELLFKGDDFTKTDVARAGS